jgi:hypothetical protein
MVEAISVITVVLFVVVAVLIVSTDVRAMIRTVRYERYIRRKTIKQATCKHEYEGRILDETVCMYCGKVLIGGNE